MTFSVAETQTLKLNFKGNLIIYQNELKEKQTGHYQDYKVCILSVFAQEHLVDVF